MKSVTHLIPFDGIGGVEIAARTMSDGPLDSDITFKKLYLTREVNKDLNSPAVYVKTLKILLRDKPDLVIASLWRSYIILILFKLVRPRARVVTFLHAAKHVHLVDRILTKAAISVSDTIWADSQHTIDGRVPRRWRAGAKVISYLLDRPERPVSRPLEPRFVFWGRLAPQKGLETAIRLFEMVHKVRPDAKFDIIGPDRGELVKLKRKVAEADLSEVIKFHGGLSRSECFAIAKDCTFYLQTSVFEGMAVSVVEAMQHGLVPVVTPVGEIRSYCRDGENAIVIQRIDNAAKQVLEVLRLPAVHDSMWRLAVAEWQDQKTYCDSMTSTILSLSF